MATEAQNEIVKQHINLHIYDTDISIMVPKEYEARYREAGSLINERLNAYFSRYKGMKSDKEVVYYAMIDIALRCVSEAKRNDVEPITDVLQELSAEIAEALK